LDKYKHEDLTPVIGREFEGLQVTELLKADPQLINDLAVTISERGVVFLRDQDVTPYQMKELMEKISEAAGCVCFTCPALQNVKCSANISIKPESSGLHVHPLTEAGSELGDQISVISSEKQKKGGGLTHQLSDVSRFASAGWHADITFEPVSSDYAMLKIHTLPATGGDTVSTPTTTLA
jgi:alpha-ketoglutarate-dependent taurine dioxygenase